MPGGLPAPLLTGNDIALAQQGCQLAVAWWRQQLRTTYRDKEIRKLEELVKKLDGAADHLNPYVLTPQDMPLDWGNDPIYGPLPSTMSEKARST